MCVRCHFFILFGFIIYKQSYIIKLNKEGYVIMTDLERLLVNERELVKDFVTQLKQGEISQDYFITRVELMLNNTTSFEIYKNNIQ